MSNRTRQVLFFVILVGVPIGAWVFVFHPRNQAISAARVDVDLKRARLEELREVEAINADLEATLGTLQSALRQLRARIPDAAGVEDVLRRIAEIARQNHLVIRSFRREKTVSASHYTELPLETVIEGSFAGIHRFLFDLERMPRITRILDMRIERPRRSGRSDPDPGEDLIRAEMVITIYADPDKEDDR